ncbi:MAG: class I SAM-dependent methyltransferase [Polyangiaceae bacterium]|nr:class I SAM-dependent methyltransferase [Polyangiaceae bacterium]
MNEQVEKGVPRLVFNEHDAALFETFVIPSYFHHFWRLAQNLFLVGEAARVAFLEARTGYPMNQVLEIQPECTGVLVDPSAVALEDARQKVPAGLFDLIQAPGDQSEQPLASCSHVLLLHPEGSLARYEQLFAEASRLLYSGGQAIVSIPLSHSFPEIFDLLGEYALKYDHGELTAALERSAGEHLTIESLSQALEEVGFHDIDFEVEVVELEFGSGRELLEDPACRMMIRPQLEAWLEIGDLSEAFEYVAHAVDRYFSEDTLEMSMTILALSARR